MTLHRTTFQQSCWAARGSLLLILLVFAARIVPTWTTFSDTVDEPYHLGAGLSILTTGRLTRGFQHPPLARIVAALPVYYSGIHDRSENALGAPSDLGAFTVGHDALLSKRMGYWSVLVRARAAMLVFPLLTLVYCYYLTRWLAGRWPGVLAAAWFSFDPTLLGHSTWITNDVAAAAGFLAVLYHGLRFIARPTWKRALVAAVAAGLGVSCKFTVLMAAPSLFAVLLIYRPGRMRAWGLSLVILAGAFLTLWQTYQFQIGPDGWPMPALWDGLAVMRRHATIGHSSYLNGEVSQRGWLSYFPEALLLKCTISSLLGFLICLPLMVKREHRRAALFAIPAVLFVVVLALGRVDIGIRHILPAIAVAYPLMATVLRRQPKLLAVLVMGSCVETAIIHPEYLSYFNALAGGASGGERYLLDSNLDWGQDQWRAHEWLETHARGRDVGIHVLGSPRLMAWPHAAYRIESPAEQPHGLIVLSKSIKHGVSVTYHLDADGREIRQLPITVAPGATPIATIGNSIEVYDLDR